MTPMQIISSLEARGVRLVPDPAAPSGFRAVAPRGVVTPRVAAKIRAALPMLRPLIELEKVATAPNPLAAPAVEDPALAKLGAQVEAALSLHEQEAERLALADAWREAGAGTLDRLGAWPKSRGVSAPSPSRWLTLAVGRAARLEVLHGPNWWKACATGRELSEDLIEFARWYGAEGAKS